MADEAVLAVAHAASPLLFTEDCTPDFENREAAERDERAGQARLLRDIFGPLLFRDVPTCLAWLTPAVFSLARRAYDDRLLPSGTLDPTHLTELANALAAAGYTDAELLGHLRSPGPHVRGCHVIDMILGRG